MDNEAGIANYGPGNYTAALAYYEKCLKIWDLSSTR